MCILQAVLWWQQVNRGKCLKVRTKEVTLMSLITSLNRKSHTLLNNQCHEIAWLNISSLKPLSLSLPPIASRHPSSTMVRNNWPLWLTGTTGGHAFGYLCWHDSQKPQTPHGHTRSNTTLTHLLIVWLNRGTVVQSPGCVGELSAKADHFILWSQMCFHLNTILPTLHWRNNKYILLSESHAKGLK